MQTFPYQITENVSRISHDKVMKSGWRIFLEREAEATKYIRSHTSIPVPEVLEIRPCEDNPEKCELVMEYISGDPLHVAWPKMTHQQRSEVILQLKSYIEEMRRLPQPHNGWIESCSGGPAMDHRVGDGCPFGPLSTESEFNELLMEEIKKHYPDSYKKWRPKLRNDHPIVFSHADLYEKHILIDHETGTVKGVIDWEMAGFWPDYWEYNKSLFSGPPNAIWKECVTKIMDRHEEERIIDWSIAQCIL